MIKALVLVLALACVTAAVSFGKKNLETPTGRDHSSGDPHGDHSSG
jgi:hypothetical protein